MRSVFISDLHLAESRPQATERFCAFLEDGARGAQALYILGDLFEYWVGDDDLSEPFNAIVAGLLQTLSKEGTGIWLMHGNRDFLLASAFCEAAGAELLADPSIQDIGGQRTLLMHGDTLCTDDADYQNWRRTARSAAWQSGFLAKPLAERRREIEALREKSKEVIAAKPADIMDVNEAEVQEAFRRHGVTRLVHGHTHRAGRHVLRVDGKPCERWVLPDWYGAGGYLVVEDSSARLVRFK
ncbi:MAG TPA: UDP-2,3-diacylglucosamine diphosphatase [Burkholderiales bacterium]|nr:UDP-2,3-diacylglucosamine diphosphatase [Burkholderiales bacterium]